MNEQIVAFIFLALNVLTFAVFGYDKWVAGGRIRRVPENVLWLLSVLGGSVGGLIGMYTFRHKTRKVSFQLVMAGIFLLQAILLAIWIYLRKGY